MQGVILTAGGDRNLILSDDGSRYSFEASQWRGIGEQPEVGTRVDFEAQGAAAVDIIPIPVASAAPSSQPSAATSAGAQTQPIGPAGAQQTTPMFSRLNEGLNTRYKPIREAIGDRGVIAVGIALLVIGCLFRFDAFEDLLDAIGLIGIVGGVAIIVLALIMLGKEEGWWSAREAGTAQGSVPTETQVAAPNVQTQPVQTQTAPPTPTASAQEVAQPSTNPMKTCPRCNAEILAAAILCRYCRADVSS